MEESTKKEFEELYGKLYEAMKEIKNNKGKRRTNKENIKYTRFTAMEGSGYRGAKNKKGKDFRFMLVGRAVNDWGEYPGGKSDLHKEEFIESSLMNIMNDPKTTGKTRDYRKDGKTELPDRFEWIDTPGNEPPKNVYRKDLDEKEKDAGNYHVAKSAFWNYSKSVWDSLNNRKESTWNERWFEKIVWTNLYKIAPTIVSEKGDEEKKDGANPNVTESKTQQMACLELLKKEIEYFEPTHILFVTGVEGWYDNFNDAENGLENHFNAANIIETKGEYVERTAEYIIKGNICKVAVICRPEGREKEAFVNEAVECYD